MVLPRGYRFVPSDGDLIYFLNEKVNVGHTTCEFLGECDMYGNKEPWEIWNDHGGLNVKKGEDLYLFTKLKKVSVNGKRINRRVGSGTWSGANCGEVVDGVGEKRHFRYENNGGRDHGAWIMHEYSLLHHHHNHHGGADDHHEYVLCRLRRKISEARERKRIKLMTNDSSNIIIHDHQDPLSSSRMLSEDDQIHLQSHGGHRDYHHQADHVQQEVALLEEQTNNGGLFQIPNSEKGLLFLNDDDCDKLIESYLNLNEQEKWSLSSSSSSNSSTDGAAADHMNNIIIQDYQQHRDDNNSNNPISFDDLIDWDVVFEDDDDELKEIMNWDDEFRIHKKSSSSTAGVEILNNQLLEDQEAGQQYKATIKSSIADDHVVVVEDEGLDKFAEKLEDILEFEIDDDHDSMEICREDFQAHMYHDHQVEADQQHINNEDKASTINDDHMVVVEDDQDHNDEALDKFAEKLEDILELEIDDDDHGLMEISREDFQAHMDHHHQVEGDQQQQQQHIINEAQEEVEIDEDDITNIDGMSFFAQELQKIPLYFATLPPADQMEDILVDDFFNI